MITLRLDVVRGETIYSVARKMVEIQKKLDIVICAEFNGVELTAEGWNTEHEIVAKYEGEHADA